MLLKKTFTFSEVWPMDLSWETFWKDFSNYGWLEIPAVITAVLYIILAARKNKWCFLFGLISSAIYVYLTIQLKLYFDTFINTYYIGMSILGWMAWSQSTDRTDLPIIKLGWKKLLLYSSITLMLSMLLGWWASIYTDDALPYWDAFTTIFALIATYWVVKRILENWLIWIVVDLSCTFIYLYKGLPLTALLFLSYTIIAIYGYKNWQKSIRL